MIFERDVVPSRKLNDILFNSNEVHQTIINTISNPFPHILLLEICLRFLHVNGRARGALAGETIFPAVSYIMTPEKSGS